jgi:hypothetical protein
VDFLRNAAGLPPATPRADMPDTPDVSDAPPETEDAPEDE